MGVSAPPKRKPSGEATAPEPNQAPRRISEKKAQEIISRGGTTSNNAKQEEPERIKNFNIKIGANSLSVIDELRAQRPRKIQSPKLGISSHDWIIEAIEEKIARERRKFNIGV